MGKARDTTQSIERPSLHGLRLTESGTPLSEFPEGDFSPNSLRAIAAVEDVSRRIEDLASSLGCLGFFDGTDGPRAA